MTKYQFLKGREKAFSAWIKATTNPKKQTYFTTLESGVLIGEGGAVLHYIPGVTIPADIMEKKPEFFGGRNIYNDSIKLYESGDLTPATIKKGVTSEGKPVFELSADSVFCYYNSKLFPALPEDAEVLFCTDSKKTGKSPAYVFLDGVLFCYILPINMSPEQFTETTEEPAKKERKEPETKKGVFFANIHKSGVGMFAEKREGFLYKGKHLTFGLYHKYSKKKGNTGELWTITELTTGIAADGCACLHTKAACIDFIKQNEERIFKAFCNFDSAMIQKAQEVIRAAFISEGIPAPYIPWMDDKPETVETTVETVESEPETPETMEPVSVSADVPRLPAPYDCITESGVTYPTLWKRFTDNIVEEIAVIAVNGDSINYYNLSVICGKKSINRARGCSFCKVSDLVTDITEYTRVFHDLRMKPKQEPTEPKPEPKVEPEPKAETAPDSAPVSATVTNPVLSRYTPITRRGMIFDGDIIAVLEKVYDEGIKSHKWEVHFVERLCFYKVVSVSNNGAIRAKDKHGRIVWSHINKAFSAYRKGVA